MERKKVLITNTIGLNYEGITSVIANYSSVMNKDGLDIHFIANTETPESLKQYFCKLGTIHYIEDRKTSPGKYILMLCSLLRSRFDVVHIHGNSGTMLIEVLLAKLYGVKNIITHAHSTKTNHPIINKVLKYPMMWLTDERVACSKAAGDWLYGKHSYTLLNNAIELSKFQFHDDLREKYRAEFCVKDEFLVGHVGHFTPQKNHVFLIDVFYEFHRLEPNSKLLLLSDGPRYEEIKEKVVQLELQDSVIFAGRRSDIAGIYSAMDMFILPSNWEGLPLVMVEAQANGLPLLVSDVITKDAKCTDRTFYKALSDGARVWAEYIQEIKNSNYDRTLDMHADIANKGFDIQREAENLRKLYVNVF